MTAYFEATKQNSFQSFIDDLSSIHAGVRGVAIWNLGKESYPEATFPLVRVLLTERKPQLKSDIIGALLLMKEKGILDDSHPELNQLATPFQKLIKTSKEQEEQKNLDIIYKALWPKG